MKIQSRNKSKLRIIIPILLVVLGAAAALGYMYLNHLGPFSENTPSSSERAEQDRAKNTDKTNQQQKDALVGGSTSKNVDTAKTTDQVPQSTDVSVQINTLSQKDGVVTYRAAATGATTGTCSAVFTNELGKPVTRTAETADGQCSAAIPEQEFDALGTWTLTVRFYSNNTQATANKTIEIK